MLSVALAQSQAKLASQTQTHSHNNTQTHKLFRAVISSNCWSLQKCVKTTSESCETTEKSLTHDTGD